MNLEYLNIYRTKRIQFQDSNNPLRNYVFNHYFYEKPTYIIYKDIDITTLFWDKPVNVLCMLLSVNNTDVLLYNSNDKCGTGNNILRHYFYRSFAFYLDFKIIIIISKEC